MAGSRHASRHRGTRDHWTGCKRAMHKQAPQQPTTLDRADVIPTSTPNTSSVLYNTGQAIRPVQTLGKNAAAKSASAVLVLSEQQWQTLEPRHKSCTHNESQWDQSYKNAQQVRIQQLGSRHNCERNVLYKHITRVNSWPSDQSTIMAKDLSKGVF